MKKPEVKRDPILVQRYPAITPGEALKLLRDLDYLAGRRSNGQTPNITCEIELRDALARHVRSGLR